MLKKDFINKFYLDKEKDIIINLYRENEDEIRYILETPNHNTGNLITNLARICGLETVKNEKNMKIITGTIPASINGDNEIVYIFRLGNIKIANIYDDGGIAIKAKIPAITKTLMSQTKEYNLPLEKTIVKSYIFKKSKFKTDLHTHMNANLNPDILISLGIVHQLRYPLYYIKKLNLKMSREQEENIKKQRQKVEEQFKDSSLTGKYLTRKIDDNTFINFADFILNNLQNAEENINKIRASLVIMKDGQAVFTNLEKVYVYRYVFAKGTESEKKIKLDINKIDRIPEKDIKKYIYRMLKDKKSREYQNNTLRQDKLLWIAREYQKQGIEYAEISNTDLTKTGMPAIECLEEIHEIVPKIEKETGVILRFLVAIRRIPLTIIKDNIVSSSYLKENLNVLRVVSKSPYVVGSDFVGEEINDITELKPVIKKIVEYVENEDKDYTIRIHAGENDSLRDNVLKSIKCVEECVSTGNKIPKIRIGHGLYTPKLNSEKWKELIETIKESGAVLEFQLTSNVRLNNLSVMGRHPLKQYLEAGLKCVQGTDGHGFYGTDTIDEQLALQNLLGLDETDFAKIREVEDEIINNSKKYFKEKNKKFDKFLNGRTLRKAMLEEEEKIIIQNNLEDIELRIVNTLEAEDVLKDKIKSLPTDKMPIIIAGGSFNSAGKETIVKEEGINILTELIKKVNPEKAYFVIGHKMQGYEKAVIDIEKSLNKKFEINSIIPKMVTNEERENLRDEALSGVCISTESQGLGIYKSFNYEIFERRKSIVIAFDGHSPVSNLVQEAKNGKGKAKIYINEERRTLHEKAKSLTGYVTPFKLTDNIVETILKENPEIV